MIDINEISVDQQFHDDPDAVLSFQDTIALNSPCTNCSLKERCMWEFTACFQFHKFVHRMDEGEREITDMPNKKIYNDLFSEETQEDKDYFTETNKKARGL